MAKEKDTVGKFNYADLMDRRFIIPGTDIRFGIDAVIGVIPGIGDWLGGFLALYFPIQATFRDISSAVVARMFFNIIIDIVIGAIPLLGDIFDVVWKANVKNARLLDRYQKDPEVTHAKSQWLNWSLVIFFLVIIVLLLLFIGKLILELLDFVF